MPKRILVIDDDEDILAILNIIFVEEGYEVILCNTGTSAAYIKLLHPDIILLDVRIRGFEKSGAEICAEIKTELANEVMPVILVSAETDIDMLAHNCGADGYISKPFDVDQILVKVKEFLL